MSDKHDVCACCGHYRFLHSMTNGECEACDDPMVKMEDRCPQFREKA